MALGINSITVYCSACGNASYPSSGIHTCVTSGGFAAATNYYPGPIDFGPADSVKLDAAIKQRDHFRALAAQRGEALDIAMQSALKLAEELAAAARKPDLHALLTKVFYFMARFPADDLPTREQREIRELVHEIAPVINPGKASK